MESSSVSILTTPSSHPRQAGHEVMGGQTVQGQGHTGHTIQGHGHKGHILYIHFKVMITKIMHYKVMVTKVTQYTTVGHHGPFSISLQKMNQKDII